MTSSVFKLEQNVFIRFILCIIHPIYEMENDKKNSYNKGIKKKKQQKNR